MKQETPTEYDYIKMPNDSFFEQTLNEMNQGKITSPDYYKLPEPEVIDLIERLAKDSKDILSVEQIVSLSHLLTYILRFPYKGKLDDLKKAKYYLDRLLQCKEN